MHELLFQINTRMYLGELARSLSRPITLADIPDTFLDRLVHLGFDWVYLLGVWQTGEAGRNISLSHPAWRREYQALLPDFTDADVCGSPFAVQDYSVHVAFGGEEALRQLRARLAERGLRLILDFVPNHTALDHAWVGDHPEYYIHGSAADLAREPHNYKQVQTFQGNSLIAHGRDPYFPGWPDTLQVNYRHEGLRRAMLGEMEKIASQCDGIRCDMAMLLLPEVIDRTWGEKSRPVDGSVPVAACFWPEAIAHIRSKYPEFVFMAEVYWDLEWTLQQQGFNYTYDKRYYDRLLAREAVPVRGHLWAEPDFQRKSVRFLENHDEPRAAVAFAEGVHQAAAVLAFTVAGLRFVHEGQMDGRRLRASMHLARRQSEPVDYRIREFYERLLECLKRPELRQGRWKLLDCRQAWDGNGTWENFIAYLWQHDRDSLGASRILVTVNFGPTFGQCYLRLPLPDLIGRKCILADLITTARFERDGTELTQRGLYLDSPPWHAHVLELVKA